MSNCGASLELNGSWGVINIMRVGVDGSSCHYYYYSKALPSQLLLRLGLSSTTHRTQYIVILLLMMTYCYWRWLWPMGGVRGLVKGKDEPFKDEGFPWYVYMFLIETSCEDSDYDDDDDGRTDSWMDGFEKQRAQYRFSTSTTTFPHSPATTTTPWAEEEEGRSVCRGMLGGLLTHFHEKKRHNKL